MHKTALAVGLAAALGAGTAHAQSGSIMLYTSQPQDLLTEMIGVFNESYPDVEIQFFRSGTTEVINRLEAEFAAGDPQPDALLVANSLVMSELDSEGRLMPYPGAPT
jgi:iron(III) transport system substrate-binding protein